MKTILSLILLLGLASCGGSGSSSGGGSSATETVTEPSVESDPEKPTIETKSVEYSIKRKVSLMKDFSNLADFKQHINSYIVTFEAKTGHYPDDVVECKKSYFDGTKKLESKFDATGTTAQLELELLPTDSSIVKFNCSVMHLESEIESLQFSLKKSYIISGQKSFQTAINSTEIQTLLIEDKSELITNGEDVELNIEELYSLNGKVITFRKEEVSSTKVDRPGLPGGNIRLNVKNGMGKITFELRGLNGGAQTRVPLPNLSVPPLNTALNGNCKTQLGRDPILRDSTCHGKRGEQGHQGFRGFPGHAGGDSGSLILKTTNENEFDVEVLYFPGKGGAGGVGGIGGKGGAGGIGATVYYSDAPEHHGCARCGQKSLMNKRYKYPDGEQGPNGLQGEKGQDGKDGKRDISRLFYTNEGFDQEINFDWKNFKESL